MANEKIKKRRSVFFSMFITLGCFLYKVALSVMTYSLVLAVASISTLMVFICKATFVRNYTQTREKKKKAYFVMFLSALIYSLIFILFVVLKVNGIDISNQKTYEGYLGILFIAFLVIMTILSIINLKGALEKSDLMVIGLKEMTFIAALTDVVVILEFVTRTVLEYKDVPELVMVNNYVPLGIGALMAVTSIFMLVRFFRYKA